MRNKAPFSIQWPLNAYIYANGLYKLEDKEWEVTEGCEFSFKNWKSAVCIIAREHYIEEQREYPITNFYHLLKIIQAEKKNISPFEGETFWAITSFTPGQFKVVFWSIPKQIIESLRNKFKFVIPESYLLVKALDSDGVFTIGKERGLFLYKSDSSFSCMIKDSLINTSERFCSLLNKPNLSSDITNITDKEYQVMLTHQLGKLPPHLFVGLYLSSYKEKDKYDYLQWKKPIILGVGLTLMYAIGLTSYLSSYQEDLNHNLSEKRKEMSVLLKTENRLNKLKENQQAYKLISDEHPGLSNLMAILSPLKDEGMVIQNIRLTGSEVRVRAVGPSGTSIFSLLSENKLVNSLDFDGSIQKYNNSDLDVFTLHFNYTRGALNE